MGNIYDPYPTQIEYEGKTYQLTLDFDNVLRAIDCQNDYLLTAEDRLDYQIKLLVKNPPTSVEKRIKLLIAIFDLFPKGEAKAERFVDLHQDASLIRSAFMRAYKIDLTTEHLHYLQFVELLADLPKDTAFVRTIEIRQRPLPKPNKHNQEEIAELIKAKARVAIKLSKEEQEARFAESLKNVFNSMKER